jgi:hypothetical protein
MNIQKSLRKLSKFNTRMWSKGVAPTFFIFYFLKKNP